MAALSLFLLSLLKQPKSGLSRLISTDVYPPSVPHIILDEESLTPYKEIFVIGDVHGCYDELMDLLNKANATATNILKIFVGDLVNKGPKNEEVLKLVRGMPSAVSVRGNHDEVVMRVYNDSLNPNSMISAKNKWIPKLSAEDIRYLGELPYSIRLVGLNTLIVHAGIIPGVHVENMTTFDLMNMRHVIIKDYFFEGGVQATKSDKIGMPWADAWQGPEHVYFGHDAKKLLQLKPLATGLDTGCVYGKKMTGIFIHGPRKGTLIDVPAREVYVQF